MSLSHTRTVRSVMDRPSFFADRLYRTMKGAGTDDNDLVRVVVARCEVDMVQIKEAFPKLYNNQGKSLASFIKVCTNRNTLFTQMNLLWLLIPMRLTHLHVCNTLYKYRPVLLGSSTIFYTLSACI